MIIRFPLYRLLYNGTGTPDSPLPLSKGFQPFGNVWLPEEFKTWREVNGIKRKEYNYKSKTGCYLVLIQNTSSGFPFIFGCFGNSADGFSYTEITRNDKGEITNSQTTDYTLSVMSNSTTYIHSYYKQDMPFELVGDYWDVSNATRETFTLADVKDRFRELLKLGPTAEVYAASMRYPPTGNNAPTAWQDVITPLRYVIDYNVSSRSSGYGGGAVSTAWNIISVALLSGNPIDITYYPIHSILSGPKEAESGEEVTVDVSFPDGYKLKDMAQGSGIMVYNDNGYIDYTYDEATNKLKFTMP